MEAIAGKSEGVGVPTSDQSGEELEVVLFSLDEVEEPESDDELDVVLFSLELEESESDEVEAPSLPDEPRLSVL